MADRRREASSKPNSADSTPALPALGFANSPPSFGLSFGQPSSTPPTSHTGYTRVGNDATDRPAPPTIAEEDEGDIAHSFRRPGSAGLGIAAGDSPTLGGAAIPSHVRNVGSAPAWSPDITLSPPGTTEPFLASFPYDSAEGTPDLRRERSSPYTGSYEHFQRGMLEHARTHASTTDFQQYMHSSDTQRLRGAPSIKSAFENNTFHPGQECQTRRDFYHSRFTWLNGTIIFICLFSTILSGIFLGLALRAPRYGRYISTSPGAKMRPATAILWTSILAKIIELSFVTGFVAFLGQVLSRRAFSRASGGRGVTLSELSMWRWVVQPGTLITHWETAKYAGLSFLGMLSLLSAILATLYAPAATALVQPMLKNGFLETRVLAASVKTDFANINYIKQMCQTPITSDKEYGGTTCTQIEHAGQGFYNYHKYLADWEIEADTGNSSSEQKKRPLGFGLLYENTTVEAQWVDIVDTKAVSQKYKRAINNVSLAMPHAGVFAAARDQRNGILQPEELDSEGTYSLHASVPSPVMKVLCVNMNESELAPIVYDTWNDRETVNITTWPKLQGNATTTNSTVVDEIFGWTKQDKKAMLDYPPVFARFPKPFNTILNHTSLSWGRSAIYLMGQGGAGAPGPNMTGIYSVCKIDVDITPYCSTRYVAGGSGGKMEALCEESAGDMAYIKSQTNATTQQGLKNWRDVGTDWSNALSLNNGIMDADASNSRLLMQLQLTPTGANEADPDNMDVDLSPLLPSMSEALAVMSGCTLLKSFLDAPFVPFWNYTKAILETPQTQYFNATIVAQQYASGGVDNPSKAWMVILFLVFLMNIFVLVYFLLHRGLVTDFSEPPNLFALAVNSPPSQALAGSCGGGPEGKQYMVNWFVNHEGEHLYMEPGEKSALLAGHEHSHAHPHVHDHDHSAPPQVQAKESGFFSSLKTAISGMQLPFGSKKRTPAKVSQPAGTERLRPLGTTESRRSGVSLSEYEMEDGETRTQRQYAKLSKRKSML
ncbi:uncharacterized protein EKO05_0006606 [Ascochyta rabiei]|uniref:Uncharacterized protein n=1 Tax=Didymella rabiei TaxID=5454 RepID=A0A162VYH2_DIDRA|nr:uncharacterized protein EKO05_0006606 [Ascochyta rabiei]KZM18673.1 hypothetical protein ST47_g10035 [Ascochyta rabiei]UPX16192.1 hypothetical protein EKO05_0006606 [Ascochyta rabiei]